MLRADALDVLEHCRAARAHQLHGAAKAQLAEGDDGLDRVGRFERDVDERRVRGAGFDGLAHAGAVGKLDGVDTGAMQDKRQEMPDAGLFIDDIADRRAVGRERRRLDGRGAVGRCRRFSSWLGHLRFGRSSNRGNCSVPRRYWCAKLVNYGFPGRPVPGRAIRRGHPVSHGSPVSAGIRGWPARPAACLTRPSPAVTIVSGWGRAKHETA